MLLQKDRPVSHRGSNSFTQGYKRICFTRTIKMAHDLELVSKELNHFVGIASFFQDWAPGTLTDGD